MIENHLCIVCLVASAFLNIGRIKRDLADLAESKNRAILRHSKSPFESYHQRWPPARAIP